MIFVENNIKFGDVKTMDLENFTLYPDQWFDVPGCADVKIFPVIRKPCVICSNAYILKTGLYIIIIDPGALLDQIIYIRNIISKFLVWQHFPVFIFLTHCHIDHFLAAPNLVYGEPAGEIICHRETARAIENRDEDITLANMNATVLPKCHVKACFFDEPGIRQPNACHPLYSRDSFVDLGTGGQVPCQTFLISESDNMHIYHTPGHSPDSVSYRLGSLLFTGDLHLAATPGIAGKSGWDNEKLAVSLGAMLEEGRKTGISFVLPGHGNIIDFERAEKLFASARKDALRLSNIPHFDRQRSLYMSEYAIILLEEASNIFSIIGARLMKISYYLELLGEEKKSFEVLCAINLNEIEDILIDFQKFLAELRGKRGAPLISKAVHFSRKVSKIFDPEDISGFFDPCFIRRIKSLLTDFINVVYGIQFKDQDNTFNLYNSVKETISEIISQSVRKTDMYHKIQTDSDFVNLIIDMIAYTPLLSKIDINLNSSDEKLYVTADKNIFQDMLVALLEQIAVSGLTRVQMNIYRKDKEIILSVEILDDGESFVLRESKLLYLQHSMKRAGGMFHSHAADKKNIYHYVFPSRVLCFPSESPRRE
ncbi:hypothetical protein TRIP_B350199 [uncultured Desulfatiglans sp.]|nr:hypothetical protein TRIP_B350199 [uncultured Desulfatiglans sp.]